MKNGGVCPINVLCLDLSPFLLEIVFIRILTALEKWFPHVLTLKGQLTQK